MSSVSSLLLDSSIPSACSPETFPRNVSTVSVTSRSSTDVSPSLPSSARSSPVPESTSPETLTTPETPSTPSPTVLPP
ncbi:fucoxanthin-chlorophyll a-c binding protein [Skeletonema marinoi]|uniref:Fucoxanthin-chlorophyll a-c binding protein n=1 Tax=Skeletonema marinoi TaxID=267567 RepID=A0AAD8XUV4_9STRA|nr:fucoxanthin-chlorophyll a-c binding protein [Skeletonema marinoi]